MRKSLAILLAAAALSTLGQAASLINLDFEQAKVITFDIPGGLPNSRGGLVSDLLPSWQLFRGETFGTRTGLEAIGYNFPYNEFTGPPYLSLQGPDQPPAGGSMGQDLFQLAAIPDEFALSGHRPLNSYWLSQRGDIPADARSIVAEGQGLRLWVDGVVVPQADALTVVIDRLVPAGSMFDISPYAGKNVEIAFEVFTRPYFDSPGGIILRQFSGLDDIRFSTQAIPEPSTMAILFGSGFVALLLHLRKRRS